MRSTQSDALRTSSGLAEDLEIPIRCREALEGSPGRCKRHRLSGPVAQARARALWVRPHNERGGTKHAQPPRTVTQQRAFTVERYRGRSSGMWAAYGLHDPRSRSLHDMQVRWVGQS